ncbi:peptidase S51 [Rufibacter radiotolerans]|uniref:Peptidase S51 n=1 Tax=Rufibacter radiotolerans TaxID=1379910 RepID=A0A0H4VQD4_9BACT|nr:peptidase E [Rufibacter radiotolerans]AKQ47543.1 peptidase S51 [Rufibacter radiotolerans]
MKRREFLLNTTLATVGVVAIGPVNLLAQKPTLTKKIFLTGGGYDPTTIKYLISLTGKENPKVCFLPTPVGDSEAYIQKWFAVAKTLPLQPYAQKVFISSEEQKVSFEETLLSMDAILVTGGNTLNAMTLWKAHGLDVILKKAWEKGILLTGPSAGAICWFEEGLSDSRPVDLSVVKGLGFLKGSNCPHYHTEKNRRPLYLKMMEEGKIRPGYACDETAGLYFENNTLKRVVSQNANDKAYFVSLKNGKAVETPLETALIS